MGRLNLWKMDFRGALAKQHRFRILFQERTDRNTTEVKQKKEHVYAQLLGAKGVKTP